MTAAPAVASDPAVAATLRLAEEYHDAARALLSAGPSAEAGARAPARFCALHAIELYLDAFLRVAGESPGRLRAHSHNFGLRAALAMRAGLDLRRKTALHLVRLTAARTYVADRYGPTRTAEPCEMNRLAATLEEIARKVRDALGRSPCTAAA